MSALPQGLLYLDTNKIYLYDPKRGIMGIDLVPSVVSDLEVVDTQALRKFVSFIIDSNKLTPLRLTLIIAEPLLFRKKIAVGPDIEEEKNKFITSVPFEHVMWKAYGEASLGQEVVATNGGLITAFRDAFEAHGWVIAMVVPTIFLGETTMTGRVPDAALAEATMRKLDSLKTYALTAGTEESKIESQTTTLDETKKQTPLLVYLLPVLGVLIIILIVFAVLQFRSPTPTAKEKSQTGKKTTTPTPSIAQISSPALLKILITENATSSASADLKSKLQGAGVTTVEIAQNPGIRAPQASVVFSNKVAQTLRTQIAQVITSIFPNASITEGGQAVYDVSITLPSQ